jgi:hypothetical protein
MRPGIRFAGAAGAAFLVLTVSAAGADFELRLVSQTSSRITLGWDQQSGVVGYVFFANGQRVSHTWDPNRTSVTFAKVTGCESRCYEVEDLLSDGRAGYPVAPPPPPPPPPPSPPSSGQFPNPSTTGVPAGWVPQTTTSSDITLSQNGQVLQDVRLTDGADIRVTGQNVVIRRVEILGGMINNHVGSTCGNGLLVEDVSILPRAPGAATNDGEGVISYGGYTARRVKIQNRNEGFRVASNQVCGPVTIEDSYAKITPPTPTCGDWHGDGIQGYTAAGLTVRNTTIDMTPNVPGCGGTAPFWYPGGQGNIGSVTVDRLLVMGQGFSFRLGMPGSVTGLRVVNNSWEFGPIDVTSCSTINPWEAQIVTIDSNYAVTSVVRNEPCH